MDIVNMMHEQKPIQQIGSKHSKSLKKKKKKKKPKNSLVWKFEIFWWKYMNACNLNKMKG